MFSGELGPLRTFYIERPPRFEQMIVVQKTVILYVHSQTGSKFRSPSTCALQHGGVSTTRVENRSFRSRD